MPNTYLFNFQGLQYLIRYPADYKEGGKYPVIIFLHGAGTRGTDINALINNAYFKITEKHEDFPFITVAPQCSADFWFDVFERLKGLVGKIVNEPFTDRERVYLMGASMGGYATWQLAMSLPEYFAAIVPICGGGVYWNAARLLHVPVWAFHGENDTAVFTEESIKMVNAVKARGGNARLTIYPNTGHDAWSATYANREVFQWLLSHKKTYDGTEREDLSNGTKLDGKRYG